VFFFALAESAFPYGTSGDEFAACWMMKTQHKSEWMAHRIEVRHPLASLSYTFQKCGKKFLLLKRKL
jgi:hypothetical protein